ncbi:MAG: cell division protein SepF [Acidimicrobiales bacterium]|jgi:cell division inhibitor SepF
MSVWNKTKLYLGLAADDEYDEYDEVAERPTPNHEHGYPDASGGMVAPNESMAHGGSSGHSASTPPDEFVLRPKPVSGMSDARTANSSAQSVSPGARAVGTGSVVRPIPAARKTTPQVVSPSSFNDAQKVGDHYKQNMPVVMNFQNVDRALSRRLIDFASGMCYGSGGQMEKVADFVYLVSPDNVEISESDRDDLRSRGLHDA